MANQIHPSSIVGKEVELGQNIIIGPYCFVRGRTKIGDGTVLDSHVSLGSDSGIVEIGKNNRFHASSVIGGPPQDISYKGEATKLIIGNDNVIREGVTLNIGTPKGGGTTQIGDGCLIMAYAHVAHDCKLGDDVQITNGTNLGGHTLVDDHAKVGGMCGINQFVKIGRYAFIAGCSVLNKDVLPFAIAQGDYAVMRACNRIGMERAGFKQNDIDSVAKAIRIITQGSGTLEEKLARITNECEPTEPLQVLMMAAKSSSRGLAL